MTLFAASVFLALAGAEPDLPSFDDAPAPQVVTRPFGSVRSQLGINVRPDSPPDPSDALARNQFELLTRASLGVDVKLSPSFRVLLEARAWWRGTTQLDFVRAKSSLEPMVGEAFVDFYSPNIDIRAGNQIVSFGANPLFAPADQLNPRDLRMSFLQTQPEDVKLPAPAVRASGEYARINWSAVYFPFFIPDRYDVFGTNEALIQPALGTKVPAEFSSSIEDQLQPQLLETQRPNAWPWLGDLGVRATRQVGPVTVGASWVWMNEKLPEVTLDPTLAAVLLAQAQGQAPNLAQVLSVESRLQAGQQLFTGLYRRQHIFSAEASALLGPAQVDLDVAYSPEQTFIDANLNPVRKKTLTWVLGVAQAGDAPFIYALTYVGVAVLGVDAEQLLLLVEPGTAQSAAHVAWLQVFTGNVGYRLWDDRFELALRGAFEPIQLSGAIGPRVTYNFHGRFHAWAGAEFYQGKNLSPFGYFNKANQILLGFNADLF